MRPKLIQNFLALSRKKKQFVMVFTDVVIVLASLWLSFVLRLGQASYFPESPLLWVFAIAPVLAIPIFIRFGLYRAIVRYIGFRALWVVVKAVSLYVLIWGLCLLLSGVEGVPRSVIVIHWMMAVLWVGSSRMIARWYFSSEKIHNPYTSGVGSETHQKHVVIYGAGAAGVQLATALFFSPRFRPVAFIDDNASLRGHQVNGLRVHPFSHLSRLIEKMGITDVLLALPSTSRIRRKEIISLLEPYPLHVRTLPSMDKLAEGDITIEDIREVEVADLLGRDAVEPNQSLFSANIREKVVMVTGAGGSIGSELCRQIIKSQPTRLVLFEQSEYALYAITQEMNAQLHHNVQSEEKLRVPVVPILGSILDQSRVEQVCRTFGVDTIYHAAAYKHVPMVEMNPLAGVYNNVIGTYRLALAAVACSVQSVVLISTDKAVRPTNTMGASKRFAELILQAFSQDSATDKPCFSMVRFGNVLGSSGSVVPLFRKQIRQGGPVTVTDPKIIRYFMTIPEAAQLVIQAGAMAEGGDVFVLDMGEPVRILELARRMIRLSALEVLDEDNPKGDIEIVFTGLRPGEKLYEELLIGAETLPTDHARIMRAREKILPMDQLKTYIHTVTKLIDNKDPEGLREVLQQVVEEFEPQCGVEDVVYRASN
jgi:UDP-N-acetylglucosamine 4,6-dehydratase